MQLSIVQRIILSLIPLVFAITVHEVAHGWVANRLGDATAKQEGRLTLNPLKHIDPIGTLLIPGILLVLGGFIFGYAKPVPVNWRNLRNIRRDMVLVALAGPLANLIMALLWALIIKLIVVITGGNNYFASIFIYMGVLGIMINLSLMILNLIPIPPLDGSRVVASFLHGQVAITYARIEPYGFLILLALLVLGVLGNIMQPFFKFFLTLITQLFGLSFI